MAQRTLVQLVDDLDGKPLEDGKGETVTFSLDSTDYEIDLNEENASELRDALSPYVKAARRVGGRRRRARNPGGARRDSAQLKDVREWAKAHGHKVSDRGRIPRSVMEAYDEAHAA